RFAEEVEPHLRSAKQLRWLLRLEPDYENLRAALAFLVEQAEQALRLCSALFWYWYLRGYLREGRACLERALAASKRGSTAVRAMGSVLDVRCAEPRALPGPRRPAAHCLRGRLPGAYPLCVTRECQQGTDARRGEPGTDQSTGPCAGECLRFLPIGRNTCATG